MKKFSAILALILTCVIWGIAFVPQRTAMNHTGPFFFGALRFGLGAIIILAVSFLWRRAPAKSKIGMRGVWLGTLLFMGISCQQIGLQYTTAGNAGFITVLSLIFVPLIVTFFRGSSPPLSLWIGAVVALVGAALLCLQNDLSFNPGDIWTLACAILLSEYIICVDKYVADCDPLNLAIFQYTVCSICSLAAAFIFESHLMIGAPDAYQQILYAGVLSVGFAYTVQLFAQQHIPPSESAVIFGLEAIVAAWAGWYFLNETLSTRQLFGAILMFIGIMAACTSQFRRPVSQTPHIAPN